MTNKTFINLNQEECGIAYKAALKNAEKKWSAAITLREHEDYASAIALHVISIEELIKAILLFFDSKGFRFRNVEGMRTFFRNHEIRYLIAYFLFVFAITSGELMNLILTLKNNPAKAKELIEAFKKDLFFEGKYKFYLLRKFAELKRELDWFLNMELSRSGGFYTDYEESLQSPLEVTETKYQEVILRLQLIWGIGRGVIQTLSENPSEEILEIVEETRKDLLEKEHYREIESFLVRLRKSRKKPLEFLKHLIADP